MENYDSSYNMPWPIDEPSTNVNYHDGYSGYSHNEVEWTNFDSSLMGQSTVDPTGFSFPDNNFTNVGGNFETHAMPLPMDPAPLYRDGIPGASQAPLPPFVDPGSFINPGPFVNAFPTEHVVDRGGESERTFPLPTAEAVRNKRMLLYEATQTYLHFSLNKDYYGVQREELIALLDHANTAMRNLLAIQAQYAQSASDAMDPYDGSSGLWHNFGAY